MSLRPRLQHLVETDSIRFAPAEVASPPPREFLIRLELKFQCKLAKPPLIVIAARSQGTESTSQLLDIERCSCGAVVFKGCGVRIEIVVIQHIDAVSGELHSHALGEREGLVERCIDVPCARTADRVAAHHVVWKWPEVGNTQSVVERNKALGKRNIQSIEGIGTQYLRFLADRFGIEGRCGFQARQSVKGFILAGVEDGERNSAARRVNAGKRPATQSLTLIPVPCLNHGVCQMGATVRRWRTS